VRRWNLHGRLLAGPDPVLRQRRSNLHRRRHVGRCGRV
jgi:hypothetical protein